MKISLVWKNLIPALIVLVLLVFSVVRTRRELPQTPPQTVLIKDADMTFYWNRGCTDKLTTSIKLKRGDSLKVLGIGKPTNDYDYYWVETMDGQRGMISPLAIDQRAVVVKGHSDEVKANIGDTATILGMKGDSKYTYNLKCSDGEQIQATRSELRYLTELELGNYQLTTPMGPYYVTKEKFEKLCKSKTAAELEDYFDHAMTVCRVDSGLRMYLNVAVLDTKTGIYAFPDITFDKTDAAGVSDIQWRDSLDRNSFFLKTLPLAGSIIDAGHSLINESFYWYSVKLRELEGWKHYLSIVLLFVLGFFWLYGTCFLLGHIFLSLVPLRYPLIWLSNNAIRWCTTALVLVLLYIWCVLMFAWGVWWWAFLPVVAYMAISFEGRFMDKILMLRCNQCKSMDSYERIHSELINESLQWCTESEYDKLVSRETERWKTWDEITYRWSSGRTETHKSNERNHSRTTSVRQYKDYKVLYLVKEYEDTYVCQCCGAQYKQTRNVPIEQSRELAGTHQTTSVSES